MFYEKLSLAVDKYAVPACLFFTAAIQYVAMFKVSLLPHALEQQKIYDANNKTDIKFLDTKDCGQIVGGDINSIFRLQMFAIFLTFSATCFLCDRTRKKQINPKSNSKSAVELPVTKPVACAPCMQR